MPRLPLCSLAALLLTATARAQAPGEPALPDERAFTHTLDSLRRAHRVPGMSAAVVRDGEVVYARGFGYADADSAVAADPATAYRIASLTKPIASAILLGMQEAGAFALDDPIKPLVPGYEAFFTQVRAYLLAHEPDLAHLVEPFDHERDDITVRHHLTHTAAYVPGDTFAYNGFLYGTLSRLMEVTAERPFHELVQARVLAPLGMTASAASQETAPAEVLARLAAPLRYDSAAGAFVAGVTPEPNVNAGAGVVSTVLDLARFDAAVDEHRLVSAATQAAAWTRQRLNDGTETPYGLGWFVQERDGAPVVWHYGWQPRAYSGLYLKLPERGLTFLLLANGENLSAPFVERGFREDAFASPFAEAFYRAWVTP